MIDVCPACHGEFANVARSHCQRFTCGWLVCRCGAVIDVSTGKFYEIRSTR